MQASLRLCHQTFCFLYNSLRQCRHGSGRKTRSKLGEAEDAVEISLAERFSVCRPAGTIDYLPVLRKCAASRNSGQVEELMS